MIFAGREMKVTITHLRSDEHGNTACAYPGKDGTQFHIVRLFPVFLALLLLCAHSWGACTTRNMGTSNTSVTVYSKGGDCSGFPLSFPRGSLGCTIGSGTGVCDGQPYNFTISCQTNSGGYGILLPSVRFTQVPCNSNCTGTGSYRVYFDYTTCDTQAEADSAYCALNPTAEGCVEEDVPPSCLADYQQCVGLGGVWTKTASSATECASLCNTCESSAGVKFRNTQIDICCQQYLAPPDSAVQCSFPAERGPGMTWSTRLTKSYDEGYSCGQLATANGEAIQENQALYKRFCLDGDRYEEQVDTNDVGGGSSSSGGEGSSSSEDIGHSFGTELEALGGLYGVLDTIRDTLTKRLTPATEQIRDCLYNFKLCTALEPLQIDWTGMPRDTSLFQVDTAILKHIKPMMDSSVKLDSAQLKVLKSLDSLYKKGLVNDSQMRILVNEINGHADGVETAVKGVRHGIDSLIDSMTTYMDKVGQGIGAVGDSIGAIRGILEGEYDGMGLYYDSAGALGDSIRHWISSGDGKYDSAVNATEASWGVGSLDSSWDSSYAYGMCHGDDCPPCTDSDCLGKITPGILRYGDSVAASLGDSLVRNVRAQEDSLPSQWDSAFARLREVSFFGAFDSTFLANVGAKIPNTNTCPDDCFRQDINGTYAYTPYNMTLDWNLCRPISAGALNGLNAFDILKLLARVITIITCLSILMWEISSRRGGGIGL